MVDPMNPAPPVMRIRFATLASSYQPFTRSRNHAMVRRIPSSNPTRGSQPRSSFAREMSGRRTRGSSSGSGWWTIGQACPDEPLHRLGELQDRHLVRIPDVHGLLEVRRSRRQIPSTLSST